MIARPYLIQAKEWPESGRHILARFDERSVWVYQAYRPEIADHATKHQRLGGQFSYNRMSWIKPNFLWMMYRSGWASKAGQERILAVRLERHFFDDLLLRAVASSYDPGRHNSREAWQAAVAASDVRLQWDPDHDPAGTPLARKAVQLGLRGAALRQYGEHPLEIADVTDFVLAQRGHVGSQLDALVTPTEQIYTPADRRAAENVGVAG